MLPDNINLQLFFPQDVANYIHGLGGIDLLLGTACRCHQPRLTEMCIGIIGNIICIQEICIRSFETIEQR